LTFPCISSPSRPQIAPALPLEPITVPESHQQQETGPRHIENQSFFDGYLSIEEHGCAEKEPHLLPAQPEVEKGPENKRALLESL